MPKPKDKPNATNYGKFRSSVAKLGIKQADLNAAVGSTVNGRTWKQISDELIAWLKERPKKAG